MSLLAALLAVSAAPEPPPEEPKPPQGERVICKKEAPTGSILSSRRVCKTQAQWQASNPSGQRKIRSMLDTMGRFSDPEALPPVMP